MSDTKKYVTVTFKRTDYGYYNIETSDTMADGDYLWWEEASVVFHVFEAKNEKQKRSILISIADPDPLASEILDLKLEVL